MLRHKTGLIPRYNWDYNFSAYTKAFTGTFKSGSNGTHVFHSLFGQEPILTNAGRTSLYCILKALNLPPGAEVGVPLFCCPVVFDVIRQANLQPRFVDIGLEDYDLDPYDFEQKRDALAAVVVVHMFGQPAEMDRISAIAGNIPVIEDCAQSLFSMYKGQCTGFLSLASFFSFRSGKYVSAGEGSALFTRDVALYEAIMNMVDTFSQDNPLQSAIHCTSTYLKSSLYQRPWYGTVAYPIGTKFDRKLNLTAKIGFRLRKIARSDFRIVKNRMPGLLSKVKKQRENARHLLKNLDVKDAILPREKKGCWSNYYQFAVRFRNRRQRDRVAHYLFQHGVDSAKYLDDVVDVAREHYHYQGDCPNAEHCSKTVLSIPHYYTLSANDLDNVVSCLNKAME